MTQTNRRPWFHRNVILLPFIFLAGAILAFIIGVLLVNIRERKDEAESYPLKVVQIAHNELDPYVWGLNFPRQYDSFIKTADDTVSTKYGGSVPYSKLEKYSAMALLWSGYSFSIDHNEERGHHYALDDQLNTQRIQVASQPGACINCHAAEAPHLIAEMGWEEFNSTPYNELKGTLHLATSCADCHEPDTMELRITRPAFANAMEELDIDLSEATRQEMRTYVCAQCHVEYYFLGENKVLTFPWHQGLNIDDIEAHYDAYEFKDWTHKETGAPMIKIQHPEFEMWSTGLHAESGVTCADCHMPYTREGAVKVSDHWLRSPLTNVNEACQTCHGQTEEELRDRIITIQDRTAELLRLAEKATVDAIEAIAKAKAAGVSQADLKEALQLHRRASIRWDFVSSENSTGFHSSQEAARILANAINYARQAQLAAEQLTSK
jgi:nitrite reductase (cytochrome c-552)